MNISDLLNLRLFNSGLTGAFDRPPEVIAHLGALQAQDFGVAKWSLGLRAKAVRDSDIERAYNDGVILRTHVMRPTWHFVLPRDIRWMLKWTAPQVKRLLATYNRKLDLDDKLFAKTNRVIVNALQKQPYLTRRELKLALEKVGVKTSVQRLAHIVSWAELDGLICSGPKMGKQLTYALLESRAAAAPVPGREEALHLLAQRYFMSHGPAQVADFAWWSGFSMKDAKTGFESISTELEQTTLNQKSYYWIPGDHPVPSPGKPCVYLLSIFDEYIIAYKDRQALSSNGVADNLFTSGNALTAVIILNGQVAGTWRKTLKDNTLELELRLFSKLTPKEDKALQAAIDRYGAFTGLPIRHRSFSRNTLSNS